MYLTHFKKSCLVSRIRLEHVNQSDKLYFSQSMFEIHQGMNIWKRDFTIRVLMYQLYHGKLKPVRAGTMLQFQSCISLLH